MQSHNDSHSDDSLCRAAMSSTRQFIVTRAATHLYELSSGFTIFYDHHLASISRISHEIFLHKFSLKICSWEKIMEAREPFHKIHNFSYYFEIQHPSLFLFYFCTVVREKNRR